VVQKLQYIRWHWRRTRELVEDLEFVVWIGIRYADLEGDITLAVKYNII